MWLVFCCVHVCNSASRGCAQYGVAVLGKSVPGGAEGPSAHAKGGVNAFSLLLGDLLVHELQSHTSFPISHPTCLVSLQVMMPHDGSTVRIRIGVHSGPCVRCVESQRCLQMFVCSPGRHRKGALDTCPKCTGSSGTNIARGSLESPCAHPHCRTELSRATIKPLLCAHVRVAQRHHRQPAAQVFGVWRHHEHSQPHGEHLRARSVLHCKTGNRILVAS